MRRDWIAQLRCPYSGGPLQISKEVAGDAERLQYGLLASRCFEFPVVDGILLLSLSKGYGGAEEELQPYVPLQVAAIKYLQQGDVEGLRGWIRRHLPLAAQLLDGTAEAYLPFAARMAAEQDRVTSEYLIDNTRFEFLGYPPPPGRLNRLLGPARYYRKQQRARAAAARRNPRAWELQQLQSYYPERFFAPRVNALALQLGSLPLDGRLLSLCCGHGVYENLLNLLGKADNVLSIDGQFLNLLVTRRYVHPQGSYICHDLQFPFPFEAGVFDGVFASTCLPEIPAQKSFVSEAVRVTAESGWTFMDSIWNLDIGVRRIDPRREYRFCQNFFSSLEDYLPFFEECAPGRELALNVPTAPADYVEDPRWLHGMDSMRDAIRAGSDWEISLLATTAQHFRGHLKPGSRRWLSAEHLALSPAYEIVAGDGTAIELRRRPAFQQLQRVFAPKAVAELPAQVSLLRSGLDDPAYLLERYCESVLVPLPAEFDRQSARLHHLR